MRLLPRSLAGRLLAISTLTTIVALLIAAFGIGHVLERFVLRGLDQQLDTQVQVLARAVRPDGTLDAARVVNLPAFDRPGEGWGWRVDAPPRRWVGGDLIVAAERPPFGPPRDHRQPDRPGIAPGEGMTAGGERVHLRRLEILTRAGPVSIIAGAPRYLADAPLREAMVPLLGSLAILGTALAAMILIQLRLGLGPLRRLQAALADVRAGKARHVPTGQPTEIAPLADELNALIDQNEAQLDQARRHVANLAHGLKTPLAALSLKLAETGSDRDGTLSAMVTDIDHRVRHHLRRARSAAPGGGQRRQTPLAPALDDLASVMRAIHVGRAIEIVIDGAVAAAVDPQDFDEMAGNLLDNACRHARSQITVTAETVGAAVKLTIDDDCPGMPPGAISDALVPGRRLDERGDGHGFGLPIAQELAELNGGALVLSALSPIGGLRATLTLPAARP